MFFFVIPSIYNKPIFVLVFSPISRSFTFKFSVFILFLIKPKLVLKFSVKLSLGPVNVSSLSIVVTPRSMKALVSQAYILEVMIIKKPLFK